MIKRKAIRITGGVALLFFIVMPARVAATSPSPNQPSLSIDTEPTVTREFQLKHARVAEVRIVLLGTLLAIPPHAVEFVMDEVNNSFRLTDTRTRLQEVAKVLPAIDQPSHEDTMQRRLMEMWVRIARFYHA